MEAGLYAVKKLTRRGLAADSPPIGRGGRATAGLSHPRRDRVGAMYVVTVRITVVPEQVSAFIAATLKNAEATRHEPDNLRFDVLQRSDDPHAFTLYEVYRDEAGFKAHQQTAHYLTWRETVASMMAAPRIGEKHHSLFPSPWQ